MSSPTTATSSGVGSGDGRAAGGGGKSPRTFSETLNASASTYQHKPLYTSNTSPSIPREILKWLQTLKLSYPIKIPRRDLATGFTVAEICAIYWADVPMHSFTNQLSIKNKESNWHLLRKIFLANGLIFKNPKSISPFQHTSEAQMAAVRLNMSSEEAEFDALLTGVMNGDGNNAFELLHILYTVFTGKVVPATGAAAGIPPPDLPPALARPPPFVKNSVASPSSAGGAAGTIPTSIQQKNAEADAVAAAAMATKLEEQRRQREVLGDLLLSSSPDKNAAAGSSSRNNNNPSQSAAGRTVATLVRKQAEAIRAAPTSAEAEGEEEGPSVQFSTVTVRPLPSHLLARFGGGAAAAAAAAANSSNTNNNEGSAAGAAGGGKVGGTARGGSSNNTRSGEGASAGLRRKGAGTGSGEVGTRHDAGGISFLSEMIDAILTNDLQINPFVSVAAASGASSSMSNGPLAMSGGLPWSLDSTNCPTLFHYLVHHSHMAASTNHQQQQTPSPSAMLGGVHTTTTVSGLIWEGLVLRKMPEIAAFYLSHPQQMAFLMRALLSVKASSSYVIAPTMCGGVDEISAAAVFGPTVSDEIPTLQNADVTLYMLSGGVGAARFNNSSNTNVCSLAVPSEPMTAADRVQRASTLLTLLYALIGAKKSEVHSSGAQRGGGGGGTKSAKYAKQQSNKSRRDGQQQRQQQESDGKNSKKELIRFLLQNIPHHTFLALLVTEMMKTSASKTAIIFKSFGLPAIVESVFMIVSAGVATTTSSGSGSGSGPHYHHPYPSQGFDGGDLSTGGRHRGGLFFNSHVAATDAVSGSTSTATTTGGGGAKGGSSTSGAATASSAQSVGANGGSSGLVVSRSTSIHSSAYDRVDERTASLAASLHGGSSPLLSYSTSSSSSGLHGKMSIISWIVALFAKGSDACDPAFIMPGVGFPLITSTANSGAAGALLAPSSIPNSSSSTGGGSGAEAMEAAAFREGLLLRGDSSVAAAAAAAADGGVGVVGGSAAAVTEFSSLPFHQPAWLAFRKLQVAHRRRVYSEYEIHNETNQRATTEPGGTEGDEGSGRGGGNGGVAAGAKRVLSLLASLKEFVGLSESGSPAFMTASIQTIEFLFLRSKAEEVVLPMANAVVGSLLERKASLAKFKTLQHQLDQLQQLQQQGGGGGYNNNNNRSAAALASLMLASRSGVGVGVNGSGGNFTVEAVHPSKTAENRPTSTDADGGGVGSMQNNKKNSSSSSSSSLLGEIGALYKASSSLLFTRPVQLSILRFITDSVVSVLKFGGNGAGAGDGIVGGGWRSLGGGASVALNSQLKFLLIHAPLALAGAASLCVPAELARILSAIKRHKYNNSQQQQEAEEEEEGQGRRRKREVDTSFLISFLQEQQRQQRRRNGDDNNDESDFALLLDDLSSFGHDFIKAYGLCVEVTELVEDIVIPTLYSFVSGDSSNNNSSSRGGSSSSSFFVGNSGPYAAAAFGASMAEWMACVDVFVATLHARTAVLGMIAQNVLPFLAPEHRNGRGSTTASPYHNTSNDFTAIAPFFASPESQQVLSCTFLHLVSCVSSTSDEPLHTSSSLLPLPAQIFTAQALARVLSLALATLDFSNNNNDNDGNSPSTLTDTVFSSLETMTYRISLLPLAAIGGSGSGGKTVVAGGASLMPGSGRRGSKSHQSGSVATSSATANVAVGAHTLARTLVPQQGGPSVPAVSSSSHSRYSKSIYNNSNNVTVFSGAFRYANKAQIFSLPSLLPQVTTTSLSFGVGSACCSSLLFDSTTAINTASTAALGSQQGVAGGGPSSGPSLLAGGSILSMSFMTGLLIGASPSASSPSFAQRLSALANEGGGGYNGGGFGAQQQQQRGVRFGVGVGGGGATTPAALLQGGNQQRGNTIINANSAMAATSAFAGTGHFGATSTSPNAPANALSTLLSSFTSFNGTEEQQLAMLNLCDASLIESLSPLLLASEYVVRRAAAMQKEEQEAEKERDSEEKKKQRNTTKKSDQNDDNAEDVSAGTIRCPRHISYLIASFHSILVGGSGGGKLSITNEAPSTSQAHGRDPPSTPTAVTVGAGSAGLSIPLSPLSLLANALSASQIVLSSYSTEASCLSLAAVTSGPTFTSLGATSTPFNGIFTPLAAAVETLLSTAPYASATIAAIATPKGGQQQQQLQTLGVPERWWSIMREALAPAIHWILHAEALIINRERLEQQQLSMVIATLEKQLKDLTAGTTTATTTDPAVLAREKAALTQALHDAQTRRDSLSGGFVAAANKQQHVVSSHQHDAISASNEDNPNTNNSINTLFTIITPDELKSLGNSCRSIIQRLYCAFSTQFPMSVSQLSDEILFEVVVPPPISGAVGGVGGGSSAASLLSSSTSSSATNPSPILSSVFEARTAATELKVKALRWWAMIVASAAASSAHN